MTKSKLLRAQRRLSNITLAVVALIISCSVGCKDKGTSNSTQQVKISVSEVGGFQFDDITDRLKLKHRYDNGESANELAIIETLGGGVAVLDYDLDGFDDLYFASGGRLDNKMVTGLGAALWRNLRGTELRPVTKGAGVACRDIYSHGTASGDFNNDGFPDVLLTGYFGIALLVNQGDGSFLELSNQAGLTDPSWGTTSGFGDFDSDGNLDFYIAQYVNWSFENHPACKSVGAPDVCSPGIFTGLSDVVWMSNGDGTFSRKTEEIGLGPEGKGLGVIIGDFTQDSKVDIYVANDTTNNFFYENMGGTFREIGLANGTAVDDMGTPQGSMGLCALDFDSDSLLDIIVANYENQSFALYKNDGHSNFRYATSTTGLMALGTTYVAWGIVAADLDLDGDEDVVVTNGHVMRGNPPEQFPLLLHNIAGAKFQQYQFPLDSYFQKKWRGRGLVKFDLDNDGDLDLAVTHVNEDAVVLQNSTKSENNWYIAKLVGINSNRNAIGAKLVVKTNKRSIMRTVFGGGSYLSQNPYYIHWGVPKDEFVESIEVTWPSGTNQQIAGSANSRMLIVEPTN